MVGYTFFASDERLKRHTRALRAMGYEVDVVSLLNPRTEPERDGDGVRFSLPRARHYARQGKLRVIIEYLLFALAVAGVLFREGVWRGRYDVVHVNNMPNFLVFSALPLRWLRGTPVLLDVHDTMPEIYMERFQAGPGHPIIRLLRWEERLSLMAASYVITTEATKLERLRENGLGQRPAEVTLNLADTSVFPCPDLDGAPRPNDPLRLVYHGTLTRRLGVDIALDALAHVRDALPPFRFEVYGDGEQRDALLEQRAALGLEEVVSFSDGFVPMEALVARLLGADLALLPSRQNVATALMLPVKLLEYARLGIPVVAVRTRTIAHYFAEDMITAVPPEDPAALGRAIVHLAGDATARREQARRARRFFDTHTFEAERARYQAVVRGLAEPGAAAVAASGTREN